MVTKKNISSKNKLEQHQNKIIEALIEEEINTFLFEQDDGGDYGGDYGGYPSAPSGFGGYGGGAMGSGAVGGDQDSGQGFKRLIRPGGFFGAVMGLDAIRGAWATAKSTAAKLITQIISTGVTLITGGVAALIPFNDPKAVTYVARKLQYWEQENLKKIEKYYEKDMVQVEAGWVVFKNDFWSMAFIVSPFGILGSSTMAEAAIAPLGAATALLNTITVGAVGRRLQSLSELLGARDIHDPGTYQQWLSRQKWEEEDQGKTREITPFKKPNTRDLMPRDRFIQHWERFSDREKREAFRKMTDEEKQNIINILGLKESISNDEELILEFGETVKKLFSKPKSNNIPKDLSDALAKPSNSKIKKPIGETIKELEKIIGEEEMRKILASVIDLTVKDPAMKKFEKAVINRDLPSMYAAMFGKNYVATINSLSSLYQINTEAVKEMKNSKTVSDLVDNSIANIVSKNKNTNTANAKEAIELSKKTVFQSVQSIGLVKPPVVQPAKITKNNTFYNSVK